MSAYVQSLVDLLDREAHPVILVGHSLAGAVISQAAEFRPDRIEVLVYAAGFLLGHGESVLLAMQGDPDGQVLPRLTFNNEKTAAILDRTTVRSFIYNETPSRLFERALPLLLDSQPVQPLSAPVCLTAARSGRARRVFVKTMQDRLFSPAAQQRAIDTHGCDQVFELDADHVPFFSRPDELTRILHSLAGGSMTGLSYAAADTFA